jgi:hypothetical protein
MLMFNSVINLLFGCSHQRITRPFTRLGKPGAPHGVTYVVCLDCGREFAYDWKEMRMGPAIATWSRPDQGRATKTAA